MDSLRNFSLLALLVLLGPAGGVSDEECGGGTICEVTSVIGQEASLNCGACPEETAKKILVSQSLGEEHLKNDQTNNSLNEKVLQTHVEIENTSAFIQKNTLPKRTITSFRGSYLKNVTLGDHNFDSNKTIDAMRFSVSNSTKDNITTFIVVGSRNIPPGLKQTEKARSQFSNCTANYSNVNLDNITVLTVNLKDLSSVNLSDFSSVTSLYIDGKNFTLTKICGAENISKLSIVSTQLKNFNFLKQMEKLKYLNLTNNNLRVIPFQLLLSSVEFIDISRNKILIDKGLVFPTNLKFINMSHNQVILRDNDTLSGNISVLDISQNRLKMVPRLDSETIEELYLAQNEISSLKYGDFNKMSVLVVLDLRCNNLSRLEGKVFEGLTKLQKLDLSQNRIAVLAPSSFQFLNNLVSLTICENPSLGRLQEVEDTSFLFGAGQRLQTIEASRTNLSRIPSTLTRSVRQLILRNNQILSIQCGEMDSFPLLQLMDLSNNVIKDVEEDALGRLDFLSHLVLFGNNLTSIPKSLPSQLQVLDLRLNFIQQLLSFDFWGQQKLKVLLLSKNRISSIEDGAFNQLVSLEILDLSYNPIKTLSRTSFMGPRKLKEMHLISLTDLIPLQEPLSFPAPESAHLEVLNIEYSPILANQLMDDVAALTMFHELFELNLNHCKLSTLRSDLPKYLPRLHKLELTGNNLNCTNVIWLVKWLQTLNISMQSTRKIRKQIYSLKDTCCEEAEVVESNNQAGVMCASPSYLSGRQIISLKEEDFPDLKLTSSALPPREVLHTEPYRQQTLVDSELIDSSSTTSSIYSTTDMTSAELSTLESTTSITLDGEELLTTTEKPNNKNNNLFQHKTNVNNSSRSYKLSSKLFRRINHENDALKYSRTEVKTSSLDPIIVLLNNTESVVNDVDNHFNNSISSGAFLSDDSPEPRSSHPGMILFLLVVGVMIVAASFMVYSQCAHGWRGRDYLPQQDIEVSSFGGNDLW